MIADFSTSQVNGRYYSRFSKMTKIFVDNHEDHRQYSSMAILPRRPTEAELTILHALWEAGPSSVGDVQRLLGRAKPTGYTTALKLLQIMNEKGLVDRDETVRPQIYRARHSREETQRRLLGDLLDRAYGGSVKALVLHALSSSPSTREELAAIEKLLDRYEGESK